MPSRKSLVLTAAESTRIVGETVPDPVADEVMVRSTLSTFKHGTEMMAYRGASPLLAKELDPTLRVFTAVGDSSRERFYPQPLGNMTVGVVEAMGPDAVGLQIDEIVFGWLPIADRHVVPSNQLKSLGHLTPDQALCVDPAGFALGAVIDGNVSAEDLVLVTGLCSIGLLAVQYAKLRGAKVVAASSFESRRNLAARYGADTVLDSRQTEDLGLAVKQATEGGVTLAIECSGRYKSLHHAIRGTRQCGRVVCVGFYAGPATELQLGEEFFHNRISLLASLPSFRWNNPTRGPHPQTPADLQRSVIDDMTNGKISVNGLLHPRVDFADVEAAVVMIDQHPDQVVKVAVQYP